MRTEWRLRLLNVLLQNFAFQKQTPPNVERIGYAISRVSTGFVGDTSAFRAATALEFLLLGFEGMV